MRFLWAALAMVPFLVVAVGMLTGRVRARSCCALPAEDDVRLRTPVDVAVPAAPGDTAHHAEKT